MSTSINVSNEGDLDFISSFFGHRILANPCTWSSMKWNLANHCQHESCSMPIFFIVIQSFQTIFFNVEMVKISKYLSPANKSVRIVVTLSRLKRLQTRRTRQATGRKMKLYFCALVFLLFDSSCIKKEKIGLIAINLKSLKAWPKQENKLKPA